MCVVTCSAHCSRVSRYEDDEAIELPVLSLRPRLRHFIPLKDLTSGQRVVVNYNAEDPKHRGYWYDAMVTGKEKRTLTATVFVGYGRIHTGDDVCCDLE